MSRRPSPTPTEFGARLRTVRLRLGLNQTEMSKVFGMLQTNYSDVERGARIFVPQLTRMLAVVGALEALADVDATPVTERGS